MSNPSKLALVIALALSTVGGTATACGPDFPHEVLSQRAATLDQFVDGMFYFEAARLVTPADTLRAVEQDYYDDSDSQALTYERKTYTPEQMTLVDAARAAADADAAFKAAEGLPAAHAHYLAGAVAFAQGDVDAAATHFQAVLDLPAPEAAARAAWAQFMLGRVAALRGDRDAAAAAFIATRERVLAGAEDPLGLAVASFGEQARLYLDDEEQLGQAIALYAEQAARGSMSGGNSLLFLARRISADEALTTRALDDKLSQRLLIAYAWSRSGEFVAEEDSYDAQAQARAAIEAPPVVRLLDALAATPERIADRERLAAVAYRAGRFDLAGQLAQGAEGGIAAWVRAKLALRAGDDAQAAAEYARAIAAFPAEENWGYARDVLSGANDSRRPACRASAELGVLALSRREFGEAMAALWRATVGASPQGAESITFEYWTDAAYVAERVLTLDELKAFVDANVPAVAAPTTPSDGWGGASSPTAALRALLARRLMREGRADEALAYFDDPTLRALADTHVAALRATASGGRIEQARAWWALAKSTRESGMELIGYEGDPDYSVYGGNFDLNSPGRYDEQGQWIDEPRQDLKITGARTSDEERARVAASVAKPLGRFHYRWLAADYAEKAADLLPNASQAYAAVLCGATDFILTSDHDRGYKLWRRYVHNGPYVPWAANFGSQCEAPDFDRAQQRLDFERLRAFKAYVRKLAPYFGGGVLVLGALWLWRRRARARRA